MATQSTAKHRSEYPAPLITSHLPSHKHTQTLIVLHGRGSNASTFGPPLMSTRIPPTNLSLRDLLPGTRFVIPTAAFRRATIYKRVRITQWFDNWSLDDPTKRTDLMIDGLKATTKFIHDLVRAEAAIVGAENIILGGLSQGCAATLIALLLWPDDLKPVRAAFGMAGWLPFEAILSESLHEEDVATAAEEDHADFFDRGTEDHDGATGAQSPLTRVLHRLCEELDLPVPSKQTVLETPVFLGHGTLDEKVSPQLGRKAAELLKSVGFVVTWKEYDGLKHWYHSEELADVLAFIEDAAGKENVDRVCV